MSRAVTSRYSRHACRVLSQQVLCSSLQQLQQLVALHHCHANDGQSYIKLNMLLSTLYAGSQGV
jgi:hypothetical protein